MPAQRLREKTSVFRDIYQVPIASLKDFGEKGRGKKYRRNQPTYPRGGCINYTQVKKTTVM